LHWDLTWPWLNLGNVFASVTTWVQWYEYTGAFGGTLWVLAANFLVYYMLKAIRGTTKVKIITASALVAWLAVPLLVSLLIYYHHTPKQSGAGIEAVVVQPNTDAWEEEYAMSHAEHIMRLFTTAQPQITPATQLIVCPESALPHNLYEHILLTKNYTSENSAYVPFILLDSLITHNPNLNFILGLSTVEVYNYKVSPTCREVSNGKFLEYYNTSCCYNRQQINGLYHKSRLVPGVEKMPFPKLFGFLESLVIDLGGTSGSLGQDSAQHAFTLYFNNDSCKVGVPICYESIYGELFGGFVRHGAQLMCVITNDDWWGNTPGHRQHFLMSKLRAIECRRTVLRSANTGISAIINERGDVLQQTEYKTRIALEQTVYLNAQITFYAAHGDYIARFALCLAVLSFLFVIVLTCFRIFARKKCSSLLRFFKS
ncbi:MAG: apolipoprotein N-acyltransferase, partial [Bacteroidales bacterium]|nr:apolipoprotein N-acyltransferase [Bacteroidales bacterium]